MVIRNLFAAIIIAIFSTSTLCTLVAPNAQQVFDDQDGHIVPRKGGKVHGANPARYCSDPSTDIFKIMSLNFYPTNPTIGYYFTIMFFGTFSEATGDSPWLNVTGYLGGESEVRELYSQPLCDIDVFQEIEVPGQKGAYRHRSCPPGVNKGYAEVSTPPIPMSPQYSLHAGNYFLHAEATTQDGRSIFCVEGSFDVEEHNEKA